MIDVEKILRKRKPKGEDMGRLEIAKLMDEYSDTLMRDAGGDVERIPATIRDFFKERGYHPDRYDSEKLAKLYQRYEENATDTDRYMYAAFQTLYSWINHQQGTAQIYSNRATTAFNSLVHNINDAAASEEVLRYVSALPKIMTETEYETLKREEGSVPQSVFGIAVIQEESRLEEAGAYIKPKPIEEIANFLGLEQFINSAERREIAVMNKIILLQSLYYVYGLNTIIDLVADVLKIEDIKLAKVDITAGREAIAPYNHLRQTLYRSISRGGYQGDEAKQQKLDILDTTLTAIDENELEIPYDRLAMARDLIKHYPLQDSTLFNYNNTKLIQLLCFK